MVNFREVMDAYDEYHEWIESGRVNEDKGKALKDYLERTVQLYFFSDGELSEDAFKYANANSPLGFMKSNGKVGVEINVDQNQPETAWASPD